MASATVQTVRRRLTRGTRAPVVADHGKLIFQAAKDDLCSMMDVFPLDRALPALSELLAADGDRTNQVVEHALRADG